MVMDKRKGIPRTAEVKEKISKSHFGIKPNDETRLKMSLVKLGKTRAGNPENWKHTEESNLKNSLAHRGSKGSGWKGGLTSLIRIIRRSLKYRMWRTAVFTRDNFTCVWCGANKKYLNADHVKQFALLLREQNITNLEEAEDCVGLWDVNNGRTLCIDCHKETDTYLNKGKEYLKKYVI